MAAIACLHHEAVAEDAAVFDDRFVMSFDAVATHSVERFRYAIFPVEHLFP